MKKTLFFNISFLFFHKHPFLVAAMFISCNVIHILTLNFSQRVFDCFELFCMMIAYLQLDSDMYCIMMNTIFYIASTYKIIDMSHTLHLLQEHI